MQNEPFALSVPARIQHNLGHVELLELAVRRGEGRLASSGAFVVETGVHTGRSVQDKFTVRDATTEPHVWWDNNKPISAASFEAIYQDFLTHAAKLELFVEDLYAGADPSHRLNARIFTEYAWHAAFIRHLLRRPAASELAGFAPEFTVVNLPSFRADPARHGCRSETVIACDFTRRLVLIGGTSYAGETKKSVFTYLNYMMPEMGVMPMHCSANVSHDGEAAIFFGLSGTGKTTLSADPKRILLGDDEHGWSKHGIFNFEGGCYAKTIRLSQEAEPEIFAASSRFGTVLENVVVKGPDRDVDFDDGKLTENTRSAYPLEFIANASPTGMAGHPKNVVMLCADAFGVLPPIARLTPSQAMYHFLSGYTAKVAGTEKGLGRRAAGHLLDLLRRAVHAAPSERLRQHAAAADRRAQGRLLAGEHRLDGRQVRRRPSYADQGDAGAPRCRALGQAERPAHARAIPCSASRFRPRWKASIRRS